jgi:hypothetical protein
MEFARSDIGITEAPRTPTECCGEQYRCPKPGSHSRQNPVPAQFSGSDNGFDLVFVPSDRRLVQNHAGAAVPVVTLRDPSKLLFCK